MGDGELTTTTIPSPDPSGGPSATGAGTGVGACSASLRGASVAPEATGVDAGAGAGAVFEVEVFRAGNYGAKGVYGVEELDAIAEGYSAERHEAPVTLDHRQDGPAYGWVASVRRVGSKLVAGLSMVADEFVEWVREGRYRKISVEFYRDFEGSGRPYLRAVTFLGAGAPAVKGMAAPVFSEDEGFVSFGECERWREGGVEFRSVNGRCAWFGEDGRRIEGYPIVFDQPTLIVDPELGVFEERIAPEAFARSLGHERDIYCLWAHQNQFVIGRRGNGTLDLRADERGVFASAVPPETTWANDLRVSMGRGDVRGASFRFLPTADGDDWSEGEDGIPVRVVREAKLFEVSFGVTFPAYAGAYGGVRNSADGSGSGVEAHLGLSAEDLERCRVAMERERVALASLRCAALRRPVAAESEHR